MEKLKNISTGPSKKENDNKEDYKAKTLELLGKMQTYQTQMYAQGRYSMLIVFQGMDASGKDGAVKHVFGPINPMGCQVTGFKVPSKEESAHDFLWRIHEHTPQRGMIEIFNRSHYEDIIVPTLNGDMDKEKRETMYRHINDFEELLTDNDTVILKFLLHVGKEAQDEKLRERLTDPTKHWKHNDDDWSKKEKYDKMLDIYDDMIEATDTKHAPWIVIPTDKNRYKSYLIAEAVVDAFEKRMKLEWPELDTEMTIVELEKEED
ncbi:MAG: polyphosphate kinase 2 family protein [Candidatus Peribacteria bacterium]|nr:MAG: polyphosphate kinase 2 family protein [Candidatus Peribacteria bacterium]